MKANHDGLVPRISHDGEASIDASSRSDSELHCKTLALPRGERNRKRPAGDAKTGPANRGLADAYTACTSVRNGRHL